MFRSIVPTESKLPHDSSHPLVRSSAAEPGVGNQENAIQVRDLAKRYGHTMALSGLTMAVPRGEIFGFLGPNGAGKTTAVKLFVGLARPTSGEGRILGRPLGDRVSRRSIGYLPELFRYQDWLSAREVLALHCDLARIPRVQRRGEIDRALETVGLAGRAGDRVGTFSKGMQQRLGLGVALLGEPALIFLDEPTSALDPVGRHDVREIIRAVKSRGTTVFLNSHLLSEVEQVCDRVAVIDQGRVIAIGTIDELLGDGKTVRLQLGETGQPDTDGSIDVILQRYGDIDREGEWITIRGIGAGEVPDLVAELVGQGIRVYAVEPRQSSLEDRFLQLLEGEEHADSGHRPIDPA